MMESTNVETTPGHVLLVDDEALVRRAVSVTLSRAGYQVTPCASCAEAFEELDSGEYDVILSDIMMPSIDGIELLHEVRLRDRDVPVVLMTGAPSLQSAMRAIDYGAFKYLTKPVERDQLLDTLGQATKFYRLARIKRQALEVLGTSLGEGSDRSGLQVSLSKALQSLWIAFQPVVRASDGSTFGFEALMRSREASLPHPGAVLNAAERLEQLPQLGRLVRARASGPAGELANGTALFLNLHPSDLLDDDLFDGGAPLSSIASRVVLEVTERASLEAVPDVRARISALRGLGFRIAVDDLGAGYAGLSSFAHLEPEIVKLDMSLVRDVDSSPVKQKLIGAITAMCQDMGLMVVAEGVESEAERDALVALRCDLLQGYRFGRPGPPFVEATW